MDLWAPPPPPTDALEALIHYLVDTPEGPVGVLREVTNDENGNPETLIIGQGWFGRRQLDVPVESILKIDHRARRIILGAGAAPLEPSRWLRFFG